MIEYIIGIFVAIGFVLTHCLINKRLCENELLELPEPFVVSEYLSRMEKAYFDILEDQEPVDQTIVLWWGLDGLRLNEDGTMEWISRKKPKPVNQNVSYQPCQTIASFPTEACQSTRATMEQIHGLKMQLEMANFNTALQTQLQSYQVSYPGYYPPYFYGGIMTGYAHPRYLPQMQNCCCNQLIR